MCSNHYIIIITLIKISKRSVEHQNNKILESWKKKLYGLVFFHSAMSICIFLQRLGPCLVLKKWTIHLFIDCPLARALWFSSQWGIRIDNCELSTSTQFIHFLLIPPFQEAREDLLLFWGLTLWFDLDTKEWGSIWG